MTRRTHSSVRYVPTSVCFCLILSRVWRRIRKATKLTRTVLLFILRPNASFAVPPSYTLVRPLVRVSICPPVDFCCGFAYALLRVSTRPVAGFYTPCCGFLYALLLPVAGFYTPCFGFLHALLQCYPHSISLPTGAEVTLCG